jgi:multiple sugar transport system permease protein
LKLVGIHMNDGWAAKLIIYFTLSVIAYLYLQPFFYILSTMFKNTADLLDPTVKWIPRELYWDNLRKAFKGLQYPTALKNTVVIALFGSVLQVISCSITGYALARLKVPFKNFLFFLVIVSFLVPPQIIIIPLYVIYGKLGLLNTPFVFLIPALFSQGLKSALFIIIFRQFFKALPTALEEAAKLDGASPFRLFYKIMLPLSRSACIVVFLFSFIWYWNQFYEPSMFLNGGFTPLSIRMDQLDSVLLGANTLQFEYKNNPVTEGAKMGAAFLIISPPLLLYMLAQRWFVEGVERTGLVE